MSFSSRLSRLPLRAIVQEFGGLALVWVGEMAGLEAYALPASLAFVGVSALRRYRRGAGFPPPWVALNGGAIGFGLASILLRDRMSPDYFAAFCAAMMAGLFLWGSFWRISLIEHLARQRGGDAMQDRTEAPGIDRFFRFYTRIWGAFFAVRALVFIDMARMPAHHGPEAFVLRLSLVFMIAASFFGPSLYRLHRACQSTR
ncbi:hypothetical protein C0V97_13200 [Asaia sp. W19]|uniref:hypothetical protein n=1 Tax=unclassified Asaia TaxID=2685023 RepID=UPI000F8D1B66|nr:hypothetical protein [Asaia sp. W19]RUT25039.1 hypothetical protein C0V97_13200 [Asaia sp. W19]